MKWHIMIYVCVGFSTVYINRYVRLKGNLLFYFKHKDGVSIGINISLKQKCSWMISCQYFYMHLAKYFKCIFFKANFCNKLAKDRENGAPHDQCKVWSMCHTEVKVDLHFSDSGQLPKKQYPWTGLYLPFTPILLELFRFCAMPWFENEMRFLCCRKAECKIFCWCNVVGYKKNSK